MSRTLLVVAVLAASCGGPSSIPARTPPTPAQLAAAAAAVTALQTSKFEDANRRATAALALDPRSSRASAVRAIATYQASGNRLFTEIMGVLESGGVMKLLDHTTGRAAWQRFADGLAIVDNDLAVAATDPNFSLELCIACWEHDWNHNGRIDDRDRKMFELEYDGAKANDDEDHAFPEGDPRRRPTFRFDVGDVEWARAMIAFQRAAVELVLAYKWDEIDRLWSASDVDSARSLKIVIHVDDAARVKHARELILQGLEAAARCRSLYLAETDDDREWVPNPTQKSHPIPLVADAALFETWIGVLGDLHDLLDSKAAISIKQLSALGDDDFPELVPDAYLDFGAMLREPQDIVIDVGLAMQLGDNDRTKNRSAMETMIKNVVGKGYLTSAKRSPIVDRLSRMKRDLDTGNDTFERKLRYLLWLN